MKIKLTMIQIAKIMVKGNDTTEISQADQDIEYIKNNASFIKPVSGTITSGFGTRTPTDIVTANHSGVDIGANSGTNIIASMSGKVVLISNDGDYALLYFYLTTLSLLSILYLM